MDSVNKPLICPSAKAFDKIGIQYGPLAEKPPLETHGFSAWERALVAPGKQRFIGDCGVLDSDLNKFITRVKADFQSHGKDMAKCRESLELWVEFINPYQRLRQAIDQLVEELTSLKPLEITEPSPPLSSSDHSDQQVINEQ